MGKRKVAVTSLTEREIRGLLDDAMAECARLREALDEARVRRQEIPRPQFSQMTDSEMEIAMLNLAQRQSAGGIAHLGLVDAPSALEMAGISIDEEEET